MIKFGIFVIYKFYFRYYHYIRSVWKSNSGNQDADCQAQNGRHGDGFPDAFLISLPDILCNQMRAFGDGKTPLAGMIIAAVLNIGLDLLLVMGFKWGIAGAAAATIFSQLAAFLYCLVMIGKIPAISMKREDWSIDASVIKLLRTAAIIIPARGVFPSPNARSTAEAMLYAITIRSAILCLTIGILVSAVFPLLARPLLGLLETPEDIFDGACSYVTVMYRRLPYP